MVSLCYCVTASLTVLSVLGSARAVPLLDKLRILSPPALNLLKTSTPAAPHFVAYNDNWLTPFPPSVSGLKGFNVFALSFLLSHGAVDEAGRWQKLTDTQRTSYLNEYKSAGISLIVSAFGSTETPTSSGISPTAAADTMAAWVIQYGLNGIDVDYEDFGAFDYGTGAETWLVTYTKQLRKYLPQGEYIITHAPVAPWFNPNRWTGGGYLDVNQRAGSLIDWYNVQFYNQGPSEYTTCDTLLTSSIYPDTALFQIAANGVPLNKLVIGKPATEKDATNGYMPPSTLASCVAQAASKGWNGGVIVWQYPHADSSWITTVRGKTWPVSGLKTETSAADNVPTWVSNVQYTGGSQVTFDGYIWTANEWYEAKMMSGREPNFALPLED